MLIRSGLSRRSKSRVQGSFAFALCEGEENMIVEMGEESVEFDVKTVLTSICSAGPPT
jgi:hypothetical protein